jgi:YihY family inner membrane protein
MATPTTVPETHDTTGDDARDELRRVGVRRLAVDAGRRFHVADGTSYARAVGLSSVLALLPGLIALAEVAAAVGNGSEGLLSRALRDLAPGPAGQLLTTGVRADASVSTLVWAVGAMLLSGTFAMVHAERGANRIYGVDEHRPAARRFATAAALASTAGLVLLLAVGVIVAGGSEGPSLWALVRWPVAVVLVAAPMTAIFRFAPNRDQPHASWLLSGTVVAVALWILVTALLGLVYENVSAAGSSFGPILGVISLLVWAYLTGVALLYGLSFAAELESQRAARSRSARDDEHVRREDDVTMANADPSRARPG